MSKRQNHRIFREFEKSSQGYVRIGLFFLYFIDEDKYVYGDVFLDKTDHRWKFVPFCSDLKTKSPAKFFLLNSYYQRRLSQKPPLKTGDWTFSEFHNFERMR